MLPGFLLPTGYSVLFFFFQSKEMGNRWASVPTRGCFHKGNFNQKRLQPKPQSLDLSECQVATRGWGGNHAGQKGLYVSPLQRLLQFCNKTYPLFSGQCWQVHRAVINNHGDPLNTLKSTGAANIWKGGVHRHSNSHSFGIVAGSPRATCSPLERTYGFQKLRKM